MVKAEFSAIIIPVFSVIWIIADLLLNNLLLNNFDYQCWKTFCTFLKDYLMNSFLIRKK